MRFVFFHALVWGLLVVLQHSPALSQPACQSAYPFGVADTDRPLLNTQKLVELTRWMHGSTAPILSLAISRNGKLAYEAYASGVAKDDAHYLMSITKSVTSALVGATLQRGAIGSPEAKIADLLPKSLFPTQAREKFAAVSLKHVMGMSALDAPMTPQYQTDAAKQRFREFINTPDVLRFALKQPLLPNVGKDFLYNDVTPYLAGGAVQYAVRMGLPDFARQALFEPMDFHNAEWMHADADGTYNPAYGLRLRPVDMQKFGILYMNGGCWNGKQLLPQAWVKQSFMPWIRSTHSRAIDYGWFWWAIDRPNGWYEHRADGWKGQRIAVFSDKKVVVTMTAVVEDNTEAALWNRVVNDFVIPAVDTAGAGQSPAAKAELQSAIASIARDKTVITSDYRMVPSTTAKQAPRPFRPAD